MNSLEDKNNKVNERLPRIWCELERGVGIVRTARKDEMWPETKRNIGEDEEGGEKEGKQRGIVK